MRIYLMAFVLSALVQVHEVEAAQTAPPTQFGGISVLTAHDPTASTASPVQKDTVWPSPLPDMWMKMMGRAQKLDASGKVRAVNSFFNRYIQFGSDLAVWGAEDYWASPMELLNKGSGDCEDYAITKYYSLRLLGIDDRQLRLLYVVPIAGSTATYSRSTAAGEAGPGQAHMVLGYSESGAQSDELQILDNMVDSIRPLSKRTDFQVSYGFNETQLWSGGDLMSNDPRQSISRWNQLLVSLQGLLRK